MGLGLSVASFSLSIVFCLLIHSARSDDDSGQLLRGINSYRTSLNLSVLAENRNAACLADQIALQFKGQDCSNTTGANTVPGTEQQFSNYPDFLSHCHLNASDTQDGAVMPACVPDLVPDLVLSNFTKSQYSSNLNDTQYVGAGIASEGNWMVVVLSTNTPGGSFNTQSGVSSALKVSSFLHPTTVLPPLLLYLAILMMMR